MYILILYSPSVHFPAGTQARNGGKLFLKFKRYTNDTEKKICQDSKLPIPRVGTRIDSGGKKQKKKIVKKSHTKDSVEKKQEEIITASKVTGKIASFKGDPLDNGKFSTAIVEGLFTQEINIKEKVGMLVRVQETDEEGSITGRFGISGKCKINFPLGLSADVGSKVELI